MARRRQNGLARRNKLQPQIYESIRAFQYAETAAQIITVAAIDLLSARIRRTLV